MKLQPHHFSGALTGLLVGALVGLSSSSVVQTLVTALIAVATAIVGVVPTDGAKVRISPTAHTWMALFGVCAFAGMVSGLYIRTHDMLSPTPSDLVERWEAAGFTAPAARALVAARQEHDGEADGARPSSSVLFGHAGVADGCIDADFASAEQVASRFQSEGQPWRGVSVIIQGIPADAQLALGRALVEGFCPRSRESDE